jgi:hypothetical protein
MTNELPGNRSQVAAVAAPAEREGGLKEAAERSCWRCQSERVARNGGDESFGVGDQDEIVLGGRPNQRRSRCKHARGVGEL